MSIYWHIISSNVRRIGVDHAPHAQIGLGFFLAGHVVRAWALWRPSISRDDTFSLNATGEEQQHIPLRFGAVDTHSRPSHDMHACLICDVMMALIVCWQGWRRCCWCRRPGCARTTLDSVCPSIPHHGSVIDYINQIARKCYDCTDGKYCVYLCADWRSHIAAPDLHGLVMKVRIVMDNG